MEMIYLKVLRMILKQQYTILTNLMSKIKLTNFIKICELNKRVLYVRTEGMCYIDTNFLYRNIFI